MRGTTTDNRNVHIVTKSRRECEFRMKKTPHLARAIAVSPQKLETFNGQLREEQS
jgi:hypothetical protein